MLSTEILQMRNFMQQAGESLSLRCRPFLSRAGADPQDRRMEKVEEGLERVEARGRCERVFATLQDRFIKQ